MLDEIAQALAAREEVVELGGRKLVVRELETAADTAAFADQADLQLKLLVRCVFDEAGAPVFTDDDIPALRKSGKKRLAPLVQAVNRVNGFDVEASAGN